MFNALLISAERVTLVKSITVVHMSSLAYSYM